MTDSSLNSPAITKSSRASEESDRYLSRFVGPSPETFLPVAAAIRDGKLGASWSWVAFLIPITWLVYRKRYLWAASLLGLSYFASRAPYSIVWPIWVLVLHIGFGVFGRMLYVRTCSLKIGRIIARTSNEAERLAAIDRAGGVGQYAVLFYILLYFIASIVAVSYGVPIPSPELGVYLSIE